MVLGSAASASQETWERRFSGPTPDPLTQPLLGWSPAMCVFMNPPRKSKGLPCSSVSKEESACSAGDPGSIPGLGRSPGRRKWQPTPISLPGKSHGRRILVGHSPWGCKESGATEQLTLTYLLKQKKSEYKDPGSGRNLAYSWNGRNASVAWGQWGDKWTKLKVLR